MSDNAPTPATTALPRLGRYALLEKLGEGGMGEVYLARDTHLERKVALKVLPAHAVNDADAVGRFQREARALAQLAHPAIVQAFDCGEEEGKHFLVMEFVEGQSLAALLAGTGKVSPTRAADFGCQVARALQHAHEKGLVHRDIKPSNVLVTGQGRVKLLDLGLARFLQDQIADPARTREGMGMGTPDYASPEQFKDAHQADVRSDVYSLGCTLYHLIAGRVPFPGSSFTQKYEAHQNQEPTPLPEMCPDVPGGLALVVQKMMAKRPADRYQTAAEVAEALSPYVAGSSVSFDFLRNTGTWQGTPTMKEGLLGRRRLPWLVAALSLAGVALMFLGLVAPGWFRPDEDRWADRPDNFDEKKDQGTPKNGEPKTQPDVDEYGVLTVSQKEEGRGKYRTIAEALREARPGQTIRVLDDAVYPENLLINQGAGHRGITIEAPAGATLNLTKPLHIIGVSEVTLRGFRIRLRSESPDLSTILVEGKAAGVVLEDLELLDGPAVAFDLGPLDLGDKDEPLVVRRCTIHGGQTGIHVLGHDPDDRVTPKACRRVFVRDNVILDTRAGIVVSGMAQHVQVVGNRLSGCRRAGLVLNNFCPQTENVLLANNTFHECATGLLLWDRQPQGRNVRVCNNVFAGTVGLDLQFLLSGGENFRGQPGPGAGEGRKCVDAWTIGHNVREGSPRSERAWVPFATSDLRLERVAGIDTDRKDPVTFLRLGASGELTGKGDGLVDPSLPTYVGAVPPDGVGPWDWDRTAHMPATAQLLTVSQKEEGGGTYRSINAAVKEAKRWATIRVLDAETYSERVVLEYAEHFEGVSLEAVRGATFLLAKVKGACVSARDVPHLRIAGFRFREREAEAGSVFLTVTGRSPGVVLEQLDMIGSNKVDGVWLNRVDSSDGPDPLRVRACRVSKCYDAVVITGPTRGAIITDCRLSESSSRGIWSRGRQDIIIAGNAAWRCSLAGVQLQDLGEGSRVLLPNNTLFRNDSNLRIWDDPPLVPHDKRHVEAYQNLLADGASADFACWCGRPESRGVYGDIEGVAKAWRCAGNFRDLRGTEQGSQVPLAGGDHSISAAALPSFDPSAKEFLRPAAGSPLARVPVSTGLSLPTYAGAMPPSGVAPWDWGITWRAWMRQGRK